MKKQLKKGEGRKWLNKPVRWSSHERFKRLNGLIHPNEFKYYILFGGEFFEEECPMKFETLIWCSLWVFLIKIRKNIDKYTLYNHKFLNIFFLSDNI